MLTVACVNVGNYCGRGDEYVHRLQSALRRHLTVRHEFVCLTDADVPAEAPGWWAKLYLFERFRQHTLYVDLDTMITGNIDVLAKVPGKFTMLEDFYHPGRLASGLMAWRGDHSYIWRNWLAADRPKPMNGDQAWIAACVKGARTWQSMVPGMICSYKVAEGNYGDARVVCFHGRPRPHQIGWDLARAYRRIDWMASDAA